MLPVIAAALITLFQAQAQLPRVSDPAPAISAATRTEIQLQSPQGHRMAGEVLLPPRKKPVPVVMLISGTGRQSRDFEGFHGRYRPHRDFAEALLSAGIGVIRFDERNSGASTGDHRTARSADLRQDAQLIFDRAADVPGVNRKHMYIFGGSEGAIFAMQLAAIDPLVAGIAVAGTPFKSGRQMMRDQIPIETPRPADMTEAEWRALVDRKYAEEIAFQETRPSLADLLDYDGAATARAVSKPALVIEAMEDWQVTPPQGRQVADAMRAAGNRHVTYVQLAEVGHLLTRNPHGVTDYEKLDSLAVDPKASRTLVDWVLRAARRKAAR
jgi:pimeloyl-ACP methyl ester carboxylesterase